MPRAVRPWFRFYVEALSDRKLRRLTPAQRWLWVAVLGAARQANDCGALSIAADPMDAHDIADLAGMTVREVERALPLFERAGMLHCVDGMWVVTNWSERQYESDSSTERTRKHRSNEPDRNVPTTLVETPDSERARRTETEPPTPEGFDEFWSTYPLRKAKQAALKAWAKAVKRTTPDVIIAAAARYRDDPQRKPDYTAHPASWLNAGRWEDELIVSTQASDWQRATVEPRPGPAVPREVWEGRVVPGALEREDNLRRIADLKVAR